MQDKYKDNQVKGFAGPVYSDVALQLAVVEGDAGTLKKPSSHQPSHFYACIDKLIAQPKEVLGDIVQKCSYHDQLHVQALFPISSLLSACYAVSFRLQTRLKACCPLEQTSTSRMNAAGLHSCTRPRFATWSWPRSFSMPVQTLRSRTASATRPSTMYVLSELSLDHPKKI